MSDHKTTEFLHSLRTGKFRTSKRTQRVSCPACEGVGERSDETCGLCSGGGNIDVDVPVGGHPADAWTIRELRKLSINGSFR